MATNRPRYRPTRCRRCPARAPEAQISYGGLCSDCAERAMADSIRQMSEGAGPIHDKWKAAQLEAARRLIDKAS